MARLWNFHVARCCGVLSFPAHGGIPALPGRKTAETAQPAGHVRRNQYGRAGAEAGPRFKNSAARAGKKADPRRQIIRFRHSSGPPPCCSIRVIVLATGSRVVAIEKALACTSDWAFSAMATCPSQKNRSPRLTGASSGSCVPRALHCGPLSPGHSIPHASILA